MSLRDHRSYMGILAISGSLRSRSTNTSLLRALAMLARPELDISLWEELAQIPPFNPDLEDANSSGPVARFRTALQKSALILLSTPEYAHGVPGALKNALDWVVGSGELSDKPVVMVNASSRGTYAQASLREILKTMDARLLSDAEVTVNILGKDWTPEQIAATPEYAAPLNAFLRTIVELVAGVHPSTLRQ
jgi:chromate reductase, NAD(P)H dehydrogenase (quinone)